MSRVLPIFGCFALLLAGCGSKLNMNEKFQFTRLGVKEFTIDPIDKEQKIKVSAEPTEGTIDVFVFLEKNRKGAEANLYFLKNEHVLARAIKEKSVSLEVTVPKGEAAVINVQCSGAQDPREVTLRITN